LKNFFNKSFLKRISGVLPGKNLLGKGNFYISRVIKKKFKEEGGEDALSKSLRLKELDNFYADLNINRSIRKKQGLPCRGQRTHTNARTTRALNGFFSKRNKIKKKK